jgi:hypothetical protein
MQYIFNPKLSNAEMLAKVIIGSAQEEISLNKLTESVEQEIQEQTRRGKYRNIYKYI